MNVFETKINNNRLEIYKAHLCEFAVGACEYSNGYTQPPQAVFPTILSGKISIRPIELVLDFEGESISEITENISNFTAMLYKKAELFLPDGFGYTCVYESASDPEEKAPWIMRVKFKFSGVRHKELQVETFTESGVLCVHGNLETPAIINIIPIDGETEVTVNDITVRNIVGEVEINGIDITVTENGLNKFSDTDITQFPRFKNGLNDISIEGNAIVKVSYYPLFL